MDTPEELSQEQIREFVATAHADLARVLTLLANQPRLLNARYQEWNETALEAASHMGQRAVAEHLLAAGAPLTICAAAMLGQAADVAAFLATDPTQANATGAHGIPVLYHAALSGNPQVADVLLAHGGGAGLDDAVHGATRFGHVAMAEWLLAHGARPVARNFAGHTPLQVAEERGDAALAALLRQHGAAE